MSMRNEDGYDDDVCRMQIVTPNNKIVLLSSTAQVDWCRTPRNSSGAVVNDDEQNNDDDDDDVDDDIC